MNPPVEVLVVSRDAAAWLSEEAARSYPREACGFLLGEQRGAEARLRRLVVAKNRADRADRYFIAARDVFSAMRSARAEGCRLLGVYHSHPGAGTEPSAIDRVDAWHEWLYLIIAVPDQRIACWSWDGEEFGAVRLRCEPQGVAFGREPDKTDATRPLPGRTDGRTT